MPYKCSNCHQVFDLKPNESVRCPFCGGKILYKIRGNISKEIDAV